jgi:type VI secretion system protein ImpA
MKSIEELLRPVSEEAPAGEELDETLPYDNLIAVFDSNFALDSGVQQLENGDPEPEPVKWSDVLGAIEKMCDETKDLFLAISYARVGLVLGNLEVVETGLKFTAGLLTEFWDSFHPSLDGALGLNGRKVLFEDLARRGSFAMPFMNVVVVEGDRSRLKASHLVDVGENGSGSDHYSDVTKGLDSLEDEEKQAISERLGSLLETLDLIAATFAEKGDGSKPDFGATRETLVSVKAAFDDLAGIAAESEETAEGESDGGEGAVEGATAGGSAGPSFTGAIRTRDDVERALVAIETYYMQAEPGHPVKVAIARLRGWVRKDFMEILADIAPGSVSEAANVLLERTED